MPSLLGLNKKQNKKSPAHKGIDREDTTANTASDVSAVLRTRVGILMHLAHDFAPLPVCHSEWPKVSAQNALHKQ